MATERRRDGVLFIVAADLGGVRDLCRAAPRRLDVLGTATPGQAAVYSDLCDAQENGAFLEASGRLERRIPSRWSSHTTRCPTALATMEEELGGLAPRPARIPVFSSIAGRDIAAGAAFDALHWHWMSAHPMYLGEAAAAALRDEPDVIVSVDSGHVATPAIQGTARHLGIALPPIVDSIQRGDEVRTLARARSRLRSASRVRVRHARSPRIDDLDLDSSDDRMAYLERLRASGAVHHLAQIDQWVVVGYDEVRDALSWPEVFSSQPMARIDSSLLGADPPEHTAVRRSVVALFRQEAVAELGVFAEQTAGELLAARANASELDVVGEFAAPLAERVAGRLLGLDDEQSTQLRQAAWAHLPQDAVVREVAALGEDVPDAASVDRLLWLASTVSTQRAITSAVLLLVRDPALRDHLRCDPDAVDAFVDEAIRLHPPESSVPRLSTTQTTLGEVTIPAGSTVQLCLAAANRDPRRFEEPDRVRLDRRGPHLAFGAGVHRCPGARLARIETIAALRALLERMPTFRSVQPECTLSWLPTFSGTRLEQLVIAPS